MDRIPTRQAGAGGGVTHAFKVNGYYELPFGRGKKFLSTSSGVVDRIVGNWSIAGSGRVQSGRLLDFGNVRMIGFTEKDLAKMFELRIDNGQKVWMLPEDVINESIKAFNTSSTSSTGYGTLGVLDQARTSQLSLRFNWQGNRVWRQVPRSLERSIAAWGTARRDRRGSRLPPPRAALRRDAP